MLLDTDFIGRRHVVHPCSVGARYTATTLLPELGKPGHTRQTIAYHDSSGFGVVRSSWVCSGWS